MLDIDVNNKQEVIEAGYKLLSEGLGPVGFARFMQHINPRQGDCVKEKYERQPLSAEEIKASLLKLKAKQ